MLNSSLIKILFTFRCVLFKSLSRIFKKLLASSSVVNIKCEIFFNFEGLRGIISSVFFTRVIDLFAINWAVFLLSFKPTLFSTVVQLLSFIF